MKETRFCPLKHANAEDFLLFHSMEVSEETIEEIKKNPGTKLYTINTGEPRVEIFFGACDGPRCAWWNEERSCCGIVATR